jgi:O-antigen ligase
MGILKILFNLLIFSMPLGVVIRLSPIQNVFLYPLDAVAVLILLAFLYQVFFLRAKIVQGKLAILSSLFLFVGFVSLLINIKLLNTASFFTSIAYLVRVAAYISVMYAVQFLDLNFRRSLQQKLLVAGIVFTALGYIQYFFYNDLRNLYYLGWDEHLYRLFSTFLDPNFAGSFLVLVLIFIAGSILGVDKLRKVPLVSLLSFVFVLISIFLTYSRSAFITLIAGFVVLLTLHRQYKLILIAVAFFIAIFIGFSNTTIEGLNPLRIASVEARLSSAREALSIIQKNPIVGVGFNAYRYAQIHFGMRTAKGAAQSNADAGTDNSYLFVLATTGIVGFLFFIMFWTSTLKVLLSKVNSGRLAKISFASVVAIMINTIFINSIFYAPIMAWLFILIGLTVNRKQ